MKQQNKLKVLLQVLFVSICVILMGGFSTMDTQAKAKKTYTVQFDKNGGKGKMSSKKYTIGKSYKLSKNKFTKKNYVFVGWNTKKSGKGKSYADQKKVKNLSTKEGATVTLYAQWKKGITVKFNANSGSVDKKSMLVVKGKKYGSYAKLPTASKAGYEFKGWYTKKNGGSKVTDKTKVKNKKKHTLYAQYKVINYNIYYHLDGGKNASNPTTYNVESNSIKLGTPTREGYTFNGWYTDSAFTNKVDTIGKGSTGDLNLYASWSLANYEITYELNGGKNNRNNPDSYTIEDTITLKNPSKTGYTFDGWYTDNAYKKKVTKIEKGTTGNLKLYAKWTITTYTIGYQLDGGTNDPANPSSYQITSDTITLQPATKPGYEFEKWTKGGFSGTKVTKISKGSTGNMTLYANYTLKNYTITYVLDGGKNHDMNPPTYTIDKKVILREPTKEKHRFLGFYKDAEFTDPIEKLENAYGDITVYAKWEYIPVTKAEWAVKLVDTMGISISENDLPKDNEGNIIYTFVDIADRADAMKIEAAVANGLVPYEKDEEGGGNYFYPNGPATREFVATSAVMALGFDTKDKVLADCTDAESITYKEHVAVALHQEIISKSDNNCFNPNNMLTETERDVAIDKIEKILASATVKEKDKSENIYDENVLHIADVTSYQVECEDPSVSGNIITVSENTLFNWKAGDKVVVTSTNISAFDGVQISEGQTQTIVLPGNDIFPSGLALVVTDKVIYGDIVILTCEVPADLSLVLDEIHVAGIGEVDGSKVVAAEGVQAVYNPNGSISHNSVEDLDNAGFGVDVEGSASMPGTISFTLDELEVSEFTTLSGKVEVAIPDISYRLDADVKWGKVEIEDLYFAMTEEISLIGEVETEVHGGGIADDGAIEIGRVPFPLGTSGLSVDLVFWFNYSVSGSANITCTIQNTNGIQMINGDLRVIRDMDAQISAEAEATLEVGPKASLMLTMFGVFDLADITADAGLGVTASATTRTSQEFLVCYDVGAYLYLRVSAGDNSLIGDLLGISYEWDIFDKETSPVKKVWHFETSLDNPFHYVPECTFGEGTIKGTVMDAETNQKIPNATVKVYTPSGILTKVLYTDSDGKYETSLYCGEYTFAISADGYKSYQDVYTVQANRTTYLEASLLIDREYTEAEEGTASGKILDSVNGNEIKGATLNIRKGWNKRTGNIVFTSSTNNSGNYEVTLPLGNYTLEIVKEGYVNGYINIIVRETPTPNQNGELTPQYLEGDEGILRVVLTWGETPRDLDSHILGPKMGEGTDRFHVYYSDMNYYSDYSNSTPTVNLDRDDVTSYGPETVTVYQLKDTGTYSYYVHDYTNRYEDETNEMGEISKAKVKVYNGGQLVTTFSVPYGEGGTCWHVFDYDAETKVVTPVNTMSYVSSTSSVGRAGDAATLENMDMQTILDDMVEKKGNE